MEISVQAVGLEAAEKQLDPKHMYTALVTWYDRATKYMKQELEGRAPGRLKGKVIIKMDAYRPPRWARVRVKGSLAHLIEGGTGTQGAAGFNHAGAHWPRVNGKSGIQNAMGVSRADAFAIAKAIGNRGGNPAKPFIQPTFVAVKPHVEQLAVQCIEDALK